MLAEIAQYEVVQITAGGRCRRRRDDHLLTVSAPHDAGSLVQRQPDVALVGALRLRLCAHPHARAARVHPATHAWRGARWASATASSAQQGVRERDEERVTLSIHLAPPAAKAPRTSRR